MMWFAPIVFFLCMCASALCTVLLFRGWRRTRGRLLMWTALGFVGLALNNLFVFLDLVVFPDLSFVPLRQLSALAAVGILIWGFMWDAE